MANNNKDVSVQIAEELLGLVFYFAWGIGALGIWIFKKLVVVSPEKKLQKMKDSKTRSTISCPHCGNQNGSHLPFCQSCGGYIS